MVKNGKIYLRLNFPPEDVPIVILMKVRLPLRPRLARRRSRPHGTTNDERT